MTHDAYEPRPELRSVEFRRPWSVADRVIWVLLGLVAVAAVIALTFAYTRYSHSLHQADIDHASAVQSALSASAPSGQAANVPDAVANQALGASQLSAAESTSAEASTDQIPAASQPAAESANNGGAVETNGVAR